MVDRYSDDEDDQPYERVGYTFPTSEGDMRRSKVPSSVVVDSAKRNSLGYLNELEVAQKEIAELKTQLKLLS